jgi:hypothetical protein
MMWGAASVLFFLPQKMKTFGAGVSVVIRFLHRLVSNGCVGRHRFLSVLVVVSLVLLLSMMSSTSLSLSFSLASLRRCIPGFSAASSVKHIGSSRRFSQVIPDGARVSISNTPPRSGPVPLLISLEGNIGAGEHPNSTPSNRP